MEKVGQGLQVGGEVGAYNANTVRVAPGHCRVITTGFVTIEMFDVFNKTIRIIVWRSRSLLCRLVFVFM